MNNSTILPEKCTQFNGLYKWTVQKQAVNSRLDKYITEQTNIFSRSFVQKMILQGNVSVNQKAVLKANIVLKSGDTIIMQTPIPYKPTIDDIKIANERIDIVYEHEDFFIINKPAGILVHKVPGVNNQVTIVDWLLNYGLVSYALHDNVRPGIVHRLDKNTSGLMIIAKNPYGHAYLAKLFQDRLIQKKYVAIVQGITPPEGSIDFYIGRDPITKSRMAASRVKRDHTFRTALTHFKTVASNNSISLVEASPVTGRTHQIRIHLQAIGHPLLGDTLYHVADAMFTRHALHASALSFTFHDQLVCVASALPDDLNQACLYYNLN
ncbi:RluA family pseudouridine synthase [Candidatus Dependentiae bacterium]|nr:MAG: RluA family pseudouridine synthase [Candidatus Dependentiae bacterium]